MTTYDEYPYEGSPFPETHPDHLGALCALFGLSPAAPERCRVLELGCGVGANLIPMAAALPGSSFVGIDLSSRQIDAGLASARALGLSNIELRAMSIMDIDASMGAFDYIICHGVYSWVPPEVQAGILAACRAHLAPSGVAYISFNALPGWHMRSMIRELLLREVGRDAPGAELVARARTFLNFLKHTPSRASHAQAMLRSEIALLDQLSDSYLLHEHLAEHNRPQYFADFARDAERAGLQYVADAQFQTMAADRFGPEAEAIMKGMAGDVIEMEQYLDYLDVRLFRRALLCHTDVEIKRNMDWRRLHGLRVSSSLRPESESPDVKSDAEEDFRKSAGVVVGTADPLLKAALVVLARERPSGLIFEDLCVRALAELGDAAPTEEERASLGSSIVKLYANGALSLGGGGKPCVPIPGPRPTASPLVRRSASLRDRTTVNLLHRGVPLDRLDWSMLPAMDGSRGLEELVAEVMADIAQGKVSLEVDGQPRSDLETVRDIVGQRLQQHGRAALLMA